jgi:hypothetical protein
LNAVSRAVEVSSANGDKPQSSVVPELLDWQERCRRFQNPIAHLGRSLNHWMNMIDNAYENKLFSVCQFFLGIERSAGSCWSGFEGWNKKSKLMSIF